LISKLVHPRQFPRSEQSSRPNGPEQKFTCFEQPSRPHAFDHHEGTLSSLRTFDINSDSPSRARNSLPTPVEPKTKLAAILAANQITDTSLPHDWLDLVLPFPPQRKPSSTTLRNMEFSEQTPATQETFQNPTTEMTEATPSPIEEITTLNALLVEASPLAFLETMAPNNTFASLNAQAAPLLDMPILPEIPPIYLPLSDQEPT
jgi:hypothetical protein